MKKCSRCGGYKAAQEYNKFHRSKDGLQPYCRDCQKSHYRENSDRHKRNVRRVLKQRKDHLRDIVRKAMSGGCVQCGEKDIRVLEFDHLPGFEKVRTVSEMIRRGVSESVLREEMEKCEVVCSNHHAIRTASRNPYGTWRDVK